LHELSAALRFVTAGGRLHRVGQLEQLGVEMVNGGDKIIRFPLLTKWIGLIVNGPA
jgi:hypothetical protein